jgi:hypothetical protein
MEAVLWVALGLTTMVSAALASRRARALLTGRVALGLLMLVGGAAVNAFYLVTDVGYDSFADTSMLAFVTDTWRELVVPNQEIFIGLLVVFEAIAGVLVLIGGRAATVGMIAVLGFHVGLLFFGWGFWLWAVPMLIAVGALLRAHIRSLDRPD